MTCPSPKRVRVELRPNAGHDRAMLELLIVVVHGLALMLCGHRDLVLENVALRQQLAAMQRAHKRVSLQTRDRLFWIAVTHFWRNWRTALVLVLLRRAVGRIRTPLIGLIRRECLDHMIVLNASHLRSVLTMYGRYYHRTRTHLGLEKDAPDPGRVSPRSA